jgi:hypothetical protein
VAVDSFCHFGGVTVVHAAHVHHLWVVAFWPHLCESTKPCGSKGGGNEQRFINGFHSEFLLKFFDTDIASQWGQVCCDDVSEMWFSMKPL